MSDHMTNDHKNNVYIGVTEACEMIGYDRSTLIRHLKKHAHFVTWKMRGKEYRILLDDIDKLKTIKKYYDVENDGDAVNERLEKEGFSVTIVYNSEEDASVVLVNEELQEMKKLLQLVYQKSEADKQELLQKIEEVERERVERERLLLQERQESEHLHQQEIGEVKQLLNHQEAKRVSELRSNLEESKRAMEEVSASVEVLKEEVKAMEAGRKKGFFQKLFGR